MKRLLMVQQKLRSRKDKTGDGGRFSYRSAEDILENVKPLLAEQELVVILSDSIEEIGGRLFLKASASLWGIEGVCGEAFGYAELDQHLTKNGSKSLSNEQCTGSASSYARKYALCGLFAIDDSEQDPDGIKSLSTRIAEAKNAEDINALIDEIKSATVEERKAFNAQCANLILVYDKSEKKYINAQRQ